MKIDQNIQNLIPPQVTAPQPFLLSTALLDLAGKGWLPYGAAVEMQKDHKGRYTIKFTFTPSAAPTKYVAQFIFRGSKQIAFVPPVDSNGDSLAPCAKTDISLALAGVASCRFLDEHQLLPANFHLLITQVNQDFAHALDIPWPASEYFVLVGELPNNRRFPPNVVLLTPTFDIYGVSVFWPPQMSL